MSPSLSTGPDGLALIKKFESLALRSYPDPKTGGAPYTLGYGHTDGVCKGMKCTPAEADQWLATDVMSAESGVLSHVTVPLSQGQFDALVSLCFNVGPGSHLKDGILRLKSGAPSTLLRLLNLGDYKGAAAEFPKWCSPGSSVERGLKIRRLAEQALFMKA